MRTCEICNKENKRKKSPICRKCWRREYTKKNRKHISKVAQTKYLKNREKNLKQSKEWAKRNKGRVLARIKKRYEDNPELRKLLDKTRREFNDLKKKSKCEKCGTKENLQFHHIPPYRYDKFKILCMECHMEKHGRLLVRKNKNPASLEVTSE